MSVEFKHVPVLPEETVALLAIRDGIFFDGTIGLGGHSELLLKARAGIKVLGCDIDAEAAEAAAKRLEKYGKRAQVFCSNYANADKILKKLGAKELSGVLLDLGACSFHYDNAKRGFSFKNDGPLDMRFSKELKFNAEELVNDWPINQLAKIFKLCGQQNAGYIARQIGYAREKKRIVSTAELSAIVAKALPFYKGRVHPATKVFMALRIAINDEFSNIEQGIKRLSNLIAIGGRFAIITFHSAEDRLVKNLFNNLLSTSAWRKINSKAICPAESEVLENPRARSAQLRIIEKVRL